MGRKVIDYIVFSLPVFISSRMSVFLINKLTGYKVTHDGSLGLGDGIFFREYRACKVQSYSVISETVEKFGGLHVDTGADIPGGSFRGNTDDTTGCIPVTGRGSTQDDFHLLDGRLRQCITTHNADTIY